MAQEMGEILLDFGERRLALTGFLAALQKRTEGHSSASDGTGDTARDTQPIGPHETMTSALLLGDRGLRGSTGFRCA